MSYMDVNLTNYTGVREKKADSRKDQTTAEAQRTEKERLEAENPWSPFDYSGDLIKNEPTQYLLFSKFLYDKGFFNDMDDEQAG